ncbi:MAG: response regulator transcription factor [Proteobacteria bacterium]|nr:response regulator transcription factor [Pseudomonadota bacterium]
MKMPTACVYVVDDDSAVRNSLQLLLKSVGLQVITCDSAQTFLDHHADEATGCVLLDVRMPGMSGPAMQRELTTRGSILPVIFITGHGDVSMAVEAMQHGAFDFVEKPFHDQELLERVQRALRQNAEAQSQLTQVQSIRARYDSLTPREREVLEHVARGSSNKVVAFDLSISQRTVEIHRARLMEKMHAPSLAHLVRITRSLTAH